MSTALNTELDTNNTQISTTAKIIKKLNNYLFIVFFLLIAPALHLCHSVNDSNIREYVNFHYYFFTVFISFLGLAYLCRNLVIYKAASIKYFVVAVFLIIVSGLFNLEHIFYLSNEVFPFVGFVILLFSLQQMNYSCIDRLNILFLALLSCTATSALLSFKSVFNVQTTDFEFDYVVPYIGIILGLYLLNCKLTIYHVIFSILAIIICTLCALHRITAEIICISICSILGLSIILTKDNRRLGSSFFVIFTCCCFICYFLGFFSRIDIYSDYQQIKSNLSATINAVSDNFIKGSGYNTFSHAVLESNPNHYMEMPNSKLLKLFIECGFWGVISWLFIIYSFISSVLNNNLELKQKISNLMLICPFLIMFYMGSAMHNNALSYIILTVIFWHIDGFTRIKTVKTSIISLSKRGLSMVSLWIAFLLSVGYIISGIISISQLNRLQNNGECEKLEGTIFNPFSVALKKTEHEFQCMYNIGSYLPSSSLLKIYFNNSLRETIPYDPKIIFFHNINNSLLYVDEETRGKITETISKYYPMIKITEIPKESESDETSDKEESKSGETIEVTGKKNENN